jgi:hypothetical protein
MSNGLNKYTYHKNITHEEWITRLFHLGRKGPVEVDLLRMKLFTGSLPVLGFIASSPRSRRLSCCIQIGGMEDVGEGDGGRGRRRRVVSNDSIPWRRARSNGSFIVIQREINDVDVGAHNRIGNVRVAKRSSVV